MDASWLRLAKRDLTKAGIGLLVLIGGLLVSERGRFSLNRHARLEPEDWVPALVGAVMVLLGGVIAVRAVAKALRKLSSENLGDARGAGLGLLVTVIGYLLVLITFLSVLGVNPAGLLLGGAITGVVLGIAAQQTLSNFFAGIVLLVNRPLVVGEDVVMRSGPLGGEFEGRVVDMSLFYVRLETDRGPVSLPNAAVLASAIGPGARAPSEDEGEEEGKDKSKQQEDEQASTAAGGAPDGSERSGAV
ncbi:MAG: mechanosensitive ion channel family protein [Actinomycetota bacterium]|nr:mechanosensitive ion channel family protein [Actinomycetota bacterium]